MLPIVRARSSQRSVNWLVFMKKRARRILPPYFGALIVTITLFLIVPELSNHHIGEWSKSVPAISIGSVISHILLIHNYSPDWQYSINHPMWSVATEWQIYMFFPLFVWVWSRFGATRLLLVGLSIHVSLTYLLAIFWPNHNPWPPQFFFLFCLGMSVAAYCYSSSPELTEQSGIARPWGTRAISLFLATVITNGILLDRGQQVSDFLIGGASACALIYLTQNVRQRKRPKLLIALEWKPLVELGKFSYSLYLMHAPILALFYLLAQTLRLGPVSFQIFILTVGIFGSVLISYCFFLIIERPFINSRNFNSKVIAKQKRNH